MNESLASLGGLTRCSAPPELTVALRVMASRERQRALRPRGMRGRFGDWMERFKLVVENGMRPMALPVAGGFGAAVVLFSMFLPPVYPLRAAETKVDVPTTLTTTAIVKGSASEGVTGMDIVVDVVVGENGRMVDYSIVSAPAAIHDEGWKRRLENALIFTEFVPATSFGMPTPAKTRLYLDSSSIDVQG